MWQAVAVLEVMWDWRGLTGTTAPRWFTINPENFSGKRLYELVGDGCRLKITNACPEVVDSPRGKGTPDPEWLQSNLHRLRPNTDLVMVCGRVAQNTYDQLWLPQTTPVIEMPHPAARLWTKAALAQVSEIVQNRRESVKIQFSKKSHNGITIESLDRN